MIFSFGFAKLERKKGSTRTQTDLADMTLRFRFPERFLRALTCRAQVTAGVLFLALCFVSAFLEQGVRICVLSIAFFVSILVSCIFRIGKRKDAFLFALLCVIASGLACVSEAYTDLCFERPAQRLIEEGGEVRVSGRITRILSEGATDRVYFEAETIGEAPVSMGFLADLKAPDEKALRVGDAIAAKAEIGDTAVAVDYTAVTMPFSLAKLLCEYGFQVKYIIAEAAGEDAQAFAWLQANRPDILLYSPNNVNMLHQHESPPEPVLAVGQKAAYYFASDRFVNFVVNGGLYGFSGIRKLAALMTDAYHNPKDRRPLLRHKGWGCESCLLS